MSSQAVTAPRRRGLGWAPYLLVLPLLKPSIRVALILRTILALQVFATVLALAGGTTTVLANEAYRWYYRLRDARLAAAYASLVLLLSLVSTVVYLLALRGGEERLG